MDDSTKRPITVVHSEAHAAAFIQVGWRLLTDFRAPGDDEPYEYVLEWPHDSGPVRPEFPKGVDYRA